MTTEHGDRPEYVRCLWDEPATNARIRAAQHDRVQGVTLCGRDVSLVQRVPKDAPTFASGSIDAGVSRHYADTWRVDHWLYHTRGNGYYVACPECAAAVRSALDAGTWDRGRDT